jgi:hypothetical protein
VIELPILLAYCSPCGLGHSRNRMSFLASPKLTSSNSSWSVSIKMPYYCCIETEHFLFNSAHFGGRFDCFCGGSAGLAALFFVWSFGCGVGGTSVGDEFLVTLLLVILLHLLKSVSKGGNRRVEYPRALRTCPALKSPCFDPH